MRACVVHSKDVDSVDAVAELIAGARAVLRAAVPRCAMLFAGIDHEFALVLDRINAEWPRIQLIGCTTDGELSSGLGFAEDSLAMVMLAGDDFHVVAGVAKCASAADSASCIRQRVAEATARLARGGGGAPRLCITTPDGLTVNESTVLNALQAELGDAVPIFGGTAADQWRFTGTWQFHGTEALQDAVPFLLFGEGVVFSFGVDTGWRPIGREGRVSDVAGNVVHAIDGRPATAFYREFLGNADISHLTEYPLAVKAGEGREAGVSYLRSSSRTDEANGCIHFFADVPDGARVHITSTNRDQILAATRAALEHALDGFPKRSGGKPALALCVSCAGRKQILGSRTQEEGRILNQLIGDVPAVGFYGYGEIVPLVNDGISHFHNETFITLLLGGQPGSA